MNIDIFQLLEIKKAVLKLKIQISETQIEKQKAIDLQNFNEANELMFKEQADIKVLKDQRVAINIIGEKYKKNTSSLEYLYFMELLLELKIVDFSGNEKNRIVEIETFVS